MAPDLGSPGPDADEAALRTEIYRLNKVIVALMDRAERSSNAQGSDYSQFQTTLMLEEQVRKRTVELQAALAENEKITRALRDSEAKFRGVVSQSLVGVAITEDGRFTYANAKFREMFGYSDEEVRCLGPMEIAAEEDRPLVAEQIRRRLSGEVGWVVYQFRGVRKGGAVINLEAHGSAMMMGGKRALISMVLDITDRVRDARALQVLQEELRRQSIHDALTGLYNRRYLDDILGRELIEARRSGFPVSAIMADLDHFKQINDRYGHLAGDEVLKVAGEVITQSARGSDMCCRYGGEEFLLILPHMTRAVAVERAEQLRDTLAATRVRCGEVSLSVTASFGVATYPDDGPTADDFLGAADDALYAAKAEGRGRVCVSAGRAAVGAKAGRGTRERPG